MGEEYAIFAEDEFGTMSEPLDYCRNLEEADMVVDALNASYRANDLPFKAIWILM